MSHDRWMDRLWAHAGAEPLIALDRATLPEAAQRYLDHAIGASPKLVQAVQLNMHGEFKLNGRWIRFGAEQALRYPTGTVWTARMAMAPLLSISGHDAVVDGEGSQIWRLLGLFPVAKASGPDLAASTYGRMAAELVWLPSVLASTVAHWDASEVVSTVRVDLGGKSHVLSLEIDPAGRLTALSMNRYGNPPGGGFREERFGGRFAEEATFEGVTIPSECEIGWWPDCERFESEGLFFRATIDSATFR